MTWIPEDQWLLLRGLGDGQVLVLSPHQLSRLVKFLRRCHVDVDA